MHGERKIVYIPQYRQRAVGMAGAVKAQVLRRGQGV
jgi:hypothetical protein